MDTLRLVGGASAILGLLGIYIGVQQGGEKGELTMMVAVFLGLGGGLVYIISSLFGKTKK